jgi:predicted kinase
MSKGLKIMFISSVVLNVALVIGAIWARSYFRSKGFEMAAMTAEAEGKVIRHVLTELESADPNRIETLKEQLQKNMKQAEDVAEMWRNVAKK